MPQLKLVQKTENLRRLFFAVEDSFTCMYAVVPWSTKMLCLKLQNKAFFLAVQKKVDARQKTNQQVSHQQETAGSCEQGCFSTTVQFLDPMAEVEANYTALEKKVH